MFDFNFTRKTIDSVKSLPFFNFYFTKKFFSNFKIRLKIEKTKTLSDFYFQTFLFSFFFFPVLVSAQIPKIKRMTTFGGSGAERIYALSETIDGGYIFAGITNSWIGDGDLEDSFRRKENRLQVDGLNDIWVVKLDKNLKIQWQRVVGGSQLDVAYAITQTRDSNYVVAGYTYSNDGDMPVPHKCDSTLSVCKDAWAMKFNNRGEIIWKKDLGGGGDEYINAIQPTSDGGCVLAGFTDSNDGDIDKNFYHDALPFLDTGGDAWLVKLNADGQIVWQKTLGGTAKDEFISLHTMKDGSFIAAGYTNSIDGDLKDIKSVYSNEAWLVKFDTAFNIQWQNVVGKAVNNIDTRAYAVSETKKGEYVIAGNTASGLAIPLINDYFIAKFDNKGKLKWRKNYGGSSDDLARNIISLDSDDGVIAGGYTFSSDGDVTDYKGGRDGWLVRCDSLGNKTAAKTIGGSDFDYIFTSFVSKTGTYIFGGYTKSRDGDVTPLHNELDAWFIELSSENLCKDLNKPIIKNINDTLRSSAGITFQWFINDSLIISARNQFLVPQKSGYYKVMISDSAACSSFSDTIFFALKPIYACLKLNKNIGDTCTDLNAAIRNGKVQTDCTCKGTVTDINEINFGKKIILRDIYPNPITDKTTVQVFSPDESQIVLKLYNTVGILLNEKYISVHQGENKIDYGVLVNYPTGMYYCVLFSNDINIAVKKIIKI